MVNDYAKLVHFANGLSYGNMWERNLTLAVYAWVGAAKDVITTDFYFTVTYVFNLTGVAMSANIKVEKKNSNGVYITIGTYSVSGNGEQSPFLTSAICNCDDPCEPSPVPSPPINYYLWNTCSLLWNQISFKWNERWYK